MSTTHADNRASQRLDELHLRPLVECWSDDDRPRLVEGRFGVDHLDEVRLLLDLHLIDHLIVTLATLPMAYVVASDPFPVETLQHTPFSCLGRTTPRQAAEELLCLVTHDGIASVEFSEGWSASLARGVSV